MSQHPDRQSPTVFYAEHLAMLQAGHASALAESGFDALVIHAGLPGKQSIFDDQYFAHKPTPAFAHWLPLRKADATLLVRPDHRPVLCVVKIEDFWEKESAEESDHYREWFDEVELADPAETAQSLPPGRVAFIGQASERAKAWGLADGAINPPELLGALDRLRAHKSDYERACIAEANRRAARGHVAVQQAFAGGNICEFDLHLAYLRATRQDDCQTPYKNIVAIDDSAAVLHYVTYRRESAPGDHHSLLCDAGATCLGYASDITRTTWQGQKGAASAAFAELVLGMEELQAEICTRIRPGLDYEELHDQAHHLLADLLCEIGVARGPASDLVDSGATRCFLPHGLGHSLGIQVHDVGCRPREPRPDNPFLRNTSTITPGQVFTIEPGCYFIAALMEKLRGLPVSSAIDWDLVATLSNFGGVRIEDNIAVLDHGTVNLTRDNWPDTP